MAAKKRADHNSLAATRQRVAALSREIIPTKILEDNAYRHFEEVITQRERETWTRHDISKATQLAQVMDRLDQALHESLEEDFTVVSPTGQEKAHPIFEVISKLTGTAARIEHDLGLSASQRGISGNKQAGRNEADRKTAQTFGESSGDGDGLLM